MWSQKKGSIFSVSRWWGGAVHLCPWLGYLLGLGLWTQGPTQPTWHLKNTCCSASKGTLNFLPIWFSHLEIWSKYETQWGRPVSLRFYHFHCAPDVFRLPVPASWCLKTLSGTLEGPRCMEAQKFWKTNCLPPSPHRRGEPVSDGRWCINIPATPALGQVNSEVCVLHCFPAGLSYSCPLCGWLNNSPFIGCLPLPDSLPPSLACISLD